MTPADPELLTLARRLFWWKGPDDALADPRRLLAQVMALGTWEDVQVALSHWTAGDFGDALRHAPAGVFDPRSWHYWHRLLFDHAPPPLPRRLLP